MNMNIPFKPLALAAICATLFAGCATTGTSETLESARTEVNAASANPNVVAKAPLELKTAGDALAQGDREQREHNDRVQVDHYAYLASTRARTAQDFATARVATDELGRMQVEVDQLRLAARTREADLARAQAAQSAQAANVARADAASANRDAAYAAQQAEAARQMAFRERDKALVANAEAANAQERMRVMQLKMNDIEARETERGLLVTLGDVLFQSGRWEMQPAAAPRMDKLAAFLLQFPEKKLIIEGYTDAVGSGQSNIELSQRRAESVKAALLARGIDSSRMAIGAYGESYPVASNQTVEGRAMNRRVEVMVSDENGTLKSRALTVSGR